LLFEFILLHGDVKLSEDVWVPKDEALKDQSFGVRVLNANLRVQSLSLEGKEVLGVPAHVGDVGFSLLFVCFFLLINNRCFRRLTIAKILIVKVLGCSSLLETALNAKNDVLEDVVLDDVLEVVQLILCHGLSKVLVVNLPLGFLLDSAVPLIHALLTAVIDETGVVTKLGALALVAGARLPRLASTATLSFKVLRIYLDGPKQSHYDDYRMQAGENRVPSETRRVQDEEVRDDYDRVHQEVPPLNPHILVELVVQAWAQVLRGVLVILEKVLLLVADDAVHWLLRSSEFAMLVGEVGVCEE
jgi:hypothetical protein